MIVCSCRRISDQDYKTKRELYRRLLQWDKRCCKCLTDIRVKKKNKRSELHGRV